MVCPVDHGHAALGNGRVDDVVSGDGPVGQHHRTPCTGVWHNRTVEVSWMKHTLAGLLLLALAVWVRLAGLPAAQVLGDSVGPWWVAQGGPPYLEPHAPPFGWMLYVPYGAILMVADSMREAVAGLQVLHALAAPLAALLAWRLRPALGGALLAGLAAALSSGLVWGGLSGAQDYLAPVWIGLVALGVTAPKTRWGPVLAMVSMAGALMSHPLSLCALPLLVLLPLRSRAVWAGAGLAGILLLPRLVWGLTHPLPDSGMTTALASLPGPLMAAEGVVGGLALVGVVVGLFRTQTRALSAATLSGLVLLLAGGAAMSYLQPYHLRLLILPALAGLAALPLPALLLALLLRPPPVPTPRAGSLAILEPISASILAADSWPVMVDQAWLSALPVAEPAAVFLDLRLRGIAPSQLNVGGEVVLIVSAEPRDLGAFSDGVRLSERGRLLRGAPGDLSGRLKPWCGHALTLGGAWDGLIRLHPEVRLEQVTGWWECAESL